MNRQDALRSDVREVTVRFLKAPRSKDGVLMSFSDPAETYAVLSEGAPAMEEEPGALHVSISPLGTSLETKDEGPFPAADRARMIYLKARGVDVWWRPGRAVLQCGPEDVDAHLAAVVEFAHYEAELRRIEGEIAGSWGRLQEDKALAFNVTPSDLRRSADVSERMAQAFDRRIRYARTEPHLFFPNGELSASAQKLGEGLRERALLEARAEAVDGQMEVFEHIYEMSGQRLGEYRAARQSHLMEWAIIWLLAAESLLMLAQVAFKFGVL